MYDYIIGKITDIESDHVVVETNNIGYSIFTPNPYSYKNNEEVKVFLYNKVGEEEDSLYGFKTKDERGFFLKLINVKGLGPKIAMPILAGGNVQTIMDAIERQDISYLQKFPKVGEKLARQIILDLKGKLVSKEEEKSVNSEVVLALESLGYKRIDINKVIKDVDQSKRVEEQIKEALKLLIR